MMSEGLLLSAMHGVGVRALQRKTFGFFGTAAFGFD